MEEDAAPMMILELMPYGDLHFFLQANKYVGADIQPYCVTECVYLLQYNKSGLLDRPTLF